MKHSERRQRRRIPHPITVVLTFGGALLLFGAMLWMPWLKPGQTDTVKAAVEQGQTHTVLLLIHNAQNQLTGVVSVRADTRTLTMYACAYPTETEVLFGTQVGTLAQCYAANKKVVACLEVAANERYDAVLTLSVKAISRMIAHRGNGLMYVLPEPVGMLPAGKQLLTAVQVSDLFVYTGWSQKNGQAEAQAGLIAAVLNRYFTASCDLQQAFSQLTALCEEHLTVAQFTAIRSELEQLAAANNGGICIAQVAQGRWVGNGESRRYLLTE